MNPKIKSKLRWSIRENLCVKYLEVGTSPLEVVDLALNFSESLTLLVQLLQLVFLLKQLLLIQLLPASRVDLNAMRINRWNKCQTGFFQIFHKLYLALLERVRSLEFCLDPEPSGLAAVALVLFGCWCKTSSSLAVVASVSSL